MYVAAVTNENTEQSSLSFQKFKTRRDRLTDRHRYNMYSLISTQSTGWPATDGINAIVSMWTKRSE